MTWALCQPASQGLSGHAVRRHGSLALQPCSARRHAAHHRRAAAAAASSDEGSGGLAAAASAVLPPAQGYEGDDGGRLGSGIPRLEGRFSYKMVKAQPVRRRRGGAPRAAAVQAGCQSQPRPLHKPRSPGPPPPPPNLPTRRWKCCSTSCAAAAWPTGGARTSWRRVSAAQMLPTLARRTAACAPLPLQALRPPIPRPPAPWPNPDRLAPLRPPPAAGVYCALVQEGRGLTTEESEAVDAQLGLADSVCSPGSASDDEAAAVAAGELASATALGANPLLALQASAAGRFLTPDNSERMVSNAASLQLFFLWGGTAPNGVKHTTSAVVRTAKSVWLFECGEDAQRHLVRCAAPAPVGGAGGAGVAVACSGCMGAARLLRPPHLLHLQHPLTRRHHALLPRAAAGTKRLRGPSCSASSSPAWRPTTSWACRACCARSARRGRRATKPRTSRCTSTARPAWPTTSSEGGGTWEGRGWLGSRHCSGAAAAVCMPCGVLAALGGVCRPTLPSFGAAPLCPEACAAPAPDPAAAPVPPPVPALPACPQRHAERVAHLP